MRKYLGLIMMGAGLAVAPAQGEVQFSERLTKIAGHLGEGGVHFSVTDTKGDLQDLGELADRLLEMVPPGEVPEGLSVETLFGDLGLYAVQGRGSSSEKKGPLWHNRSFVLTTGEHKGVLSLLGDESKKPSAHSFAPANADLVLETSLNLREVERTAKEIARAIGGDAEKEILSGFKEEVLDLGFDIADLFADFTVRGTIVVWLDEEKTFEPEPGLTLPVPHLAARLENAGMVWKMLESEVKEDSKVVEKDGEIILTPKDGPEQTPFGPVLPQIVWNAKTGELFMSLTAEDLAHCRGEGPRLSGAESYRTATAGFPEELSSLAYVSNDVFRLIEFLAKEYQGQVPPEAQTIVAELIPHLEGLAAGVAVGKEGFLGLANLPFPLKGDSFAGPGGIAGIAVLAGLATPAILKAKKSAEKAKTINNLKQLGILLLVYQEDHGKYPDHLGVLMEKEYLPLEQWQAMGMEAVVYLPNESGEESAERIFAYQEIPELNEVVFVRGDSSVRSLPAKIFREQLRAQTGK